MRLALPIALCGALALSGCAGLTIAPDGLVALDGQEINLGPKLNTAASSLVKKAQAGEAFLQADVPAICAVASNLAATGQLAQALTSNKIVGQTAADATALATSPTCSGQPLSNLAALAQSIQAVAAAKGGK